MLVRLLALLVTVGVCATHAASLQWEWLTPFPHRQSWRSLAAGNGHVVGLTDGYGGRSIYTWVNCTNWLTVATPTNFIPQKVIFADGQFIAVGNNSTVITSKDGIDWKLRHTDSAGLGFRHIAAGSGMFVALAGGPMLAYSKDLVIWRNVMPDSGFTFTALAFGNGKFVAVGQGLNLFTSTDGAVWTKIPWPDGIGWTDWSKYESGLVFRNGVFLMANSNGSAVSVDGEHWSATSGQSFNNVVATPDGFLGFDYRSVSLSATGSSWSSVLDLELPMGVNVTCATSANGTTIVAGDNGLLYTTTDLVNWRRWVKPADYSESQIVFGNNSYLRYGGTNGVCISSNGADWQRIASAPGLRAANYGNNVWVGFDWAGHAVVSENGKSWETIPLPAAAKDRLLFAEGRFVGDAEGGILTTVDGRNWQFVPIQGADAYNSTIVGRANGIWCANVGGQAATSTDGLSWTVNAARIDGRVFAAGNGRFVSVSGGGMGLGFVFRSTDGINWQPEASPTTHLARSLTFTGGQFILTDNVGGIYQSADGLSWSGGRQAPQYFTSVAYGNGEFLVCGGDAILRSTTRLQSAAALKLQLVQQSFNTWTLSITGSAGQTLQIESTTDLDGPWSAFGTVTISQTGVAQLPTEKNSANRFFRATALVQ